MEEKRLRPGSSEQGRPEAPAGSVEPSDQELMALAKEGDERAVAVLYGRYRKRLVNYLYRFVGDSGTAEDLTQETFLRVVRHLPSYRPTGSVAGWIYRIARNLAFNRIRDTRRLEEVSLEESPAGVDPEEGLEKKDLVADAGPSPAEEACRQEVGSRIQDALLKIAPVYREAVILCDVQGHAYKEAAEMLHCSINTVASRLARGRARLAELLGYLRKESG